ncbi:iron chelate uptake ABC transporter family permease subunit [Phenylobacterium sp.]|uniref:iron chelate uptake ABC transporter family permease subunit n=1 Tax=Phenylobacterium sp. TaxID=1871053 RepID=UPI0037C9CD29
MIGAGLMCFADTIARTAVAPAELPLGVLTAMAGGPLFLWMLSRRRGATFHA